MFHSKFVKTAYVVLVLNNYHGAKHNIYIPVLWLQAQQTKLKPEAQAHEQSLYPKLSETMGFNESTMSVWKADGAAKEKQQELKCNNKP